MDCPKCRERDAEETPETVFTVRGSYDEAKQGYEAEADYNVFRCGRCRTEFVVLAEGERQESEQLHVAIYFSRAEAGGGAHRPANAEVTDDATGEG